MMMAIFCSNNLHLWDTWAYFIWGGWQRDTYNPGRSGGGLVTWDSSSLTLGWTCWAFMSVHTVKPAQLIRIWKLQPATRFICCLGIYLWSLHPQTCWQMGLFWLHICLAQLSFVHLYYEIFKCILPRIEPPPPCNYPWLSLNVKSVSGSDWSPMVTLQVSKPLHYSTAFHNIVFKFELIEMVIFL